jgi:hypothetical protein
MGASSSSGARPISSSQLVQAFSRDVRSVSFSMVHDLTLQWRDDPNHSRLTEADPAEACCWGAGESATALPPGMAYAPARTPVPLATLKWDGPTPFQPRAPIASPRRLATPGSFRQPGALRRTPRSGPAIRPAPVASRSDADTRGRPRSSAQPSAIGNSYLDAYSPSPTVKAHRPGLI